MKTVIHLETTEIDLKNHSPFPGDVEGFGADDGFDAFLAMGPPPTPQSTPTPTPAKQRRPSADSDEENDFNVFIR